MSGEKDIIRRCKEYRENLKKATQFLSTHSAVSKHCPEMITSCKSMTSELSVSTKNKKSWQTDISPVWKIPVEDSVICGAPGKVELAIAGDVITDNGKLKHQSISVSVILTPGQNQSHPNGYNCGDLEKDVPVVVRRFHFDYDVTISANDRPRSHIQYGGKCRPDLLNIDGIKYQLFSTLRFPRIPYPPIDLVQITDIFLQQFPTPLSQLNEENEWKRLVIESDKLWSKGYYDVLSKYLGTTGQNDSLYKRQCCHVDWI